MDPGEVRLIARISERLPGAETSPTPSQILPATLAVVHLVPGQGVAPAPDVNAKSDLREASTHDLLNAAPIFGPAGAAPALPAQPVDPSAPAPGPAAPSADPNAVSNPNATPVNPGQP
jgi:hypothetical protein